MIKEDFIMARKTLSEYRTQKNDKQNKMRKVSNYLKSTNKNESKSGLTSIKETDNYRSGSRRRNPQKELLLYKMMIKSRKTKLEKTGNRKYKLKR